MTKLQKILGNQTNIKVIAPEIDYSDYIPFDLSATTTDSLKLPLTDSKAFEDFVENYFSINQAKIAYGGYLEHRNLYQRSTVFKNITIEERNIHIGLDLWIKAGTAVLAALDGEIHSFQNNTALGDYGPTIVLEHEIQGEKFYTLYGHLSLESLAEKTEGQKVTKGEIIGQLGSAPINGDYAPHLHFQIINDMQGKRGDYPGVSSKKELAFYKKNCPDPNLLLKIK
jgi:murein DD-endopeptidase MepM/ murein hydrolase activator NlpD